MCEHEGFSGCLQVLVSTLKANYGRSKIISRALTGEEADCTFLRKLPDRKKISHNFIMSHVASKSLSQKNTSLAERYSIEKGVI